MGGRIAFQGELGAYSHEACRKARPGMDVLPFPTFQEAIDAVREGRADLAMLPVENSTYGRVADMHSLLPESGLYIIDEAYVRVQIALSALPGTKLSEVRRAMSHTVLLGQCRKFLREHNIAPVTGFDTAGSAKAVAAQSDRSLAALSPALAAELYGLEILASGIEDQSNNTTRFVVMSPERDLSRRGHGKMVTTFLFQVRNIPAALYKALGGFATNGVNMTRLESYMIGGNFTATAFLADIDGHPDDANVGRALEELRYFSSRLDVLGVYPSNRPDA